MTITRFAPSPTGFLHIGNLRTALINFLIAKKNNGTFILRLDDTDPIRSKKIYADQIKWDLEWLGLEWDRIETQSSRKEHYAAMASKLKEKGRLYEAFETPTELDLKRKKQLNKGQPPVYDRSALKLKPEAIKKLKETEPGYWRFLLNHERIMWEDGILGPISIEAKSVSDPVLIRKDGQFLYTLASVIDDVDMGITHVVRGADHVTNTGTQIQIMEAIGKKSPNFAHHSLLTGPNGEGLSKRLGTLALKDFKSKGIEPIALLSHLARIGTSNTTELRLTIEELIKDFDLSLFGSSPTKINPDSLTPLSIRYLKMLPYEALKDELNTLKVDKRIQAPFWDMAKNNINTRAEIEKWWKICSEGVTLKSLEADKDFITVAFEMLPPLPFCETTWSTWTKKVKERTGRSGKNLYMPLRRALTGLEHGPDMSKLMPLLMKINRP